MKEINSLRIIIATIYLFNQGQIIFEPILPDNYKVFHFSDLSGRVVSFANDSTTSFIVGFNLPTDLGE